MFSTLHFATVRERERRDCLVPKTIYFNITKLLRWGNIANGAQSPFKSIKFAILSCSSFKVSANPKLTILHNFGFLYDSIVLRKSFRL